MTARNLPIESVFERIGDHRLFVRLKGDVKKIDDVDYIPVRVCLSGIDGETGYIPADEIVIFEEKTLVQTTPPF